MAATYRYNRLHTSNNNKKHTNNKPTTKNWSKLNKQNKSREIK